jgi:hypothetical protein
MSLKGNLACMPTAETDTTRLQLHQLIEKLPDMELRPALRLIQFLLLDPVTRSVLMAPPDDECITEEDVAALAESRKEISEGKLTAHEEVLKEFGL